MKGFVLGASLGGVFRILLRVLKTLTEITAIVIYRCGLYVPLLYLIYGGILYAAFGFEPFGLSTDSKLYIFGLALSMICSVMIAVKMLVLKPYNKHFRRTSVIEYTSDAKLSRDAPEAPRIYKSKVNPGIIVYEYSNRYDLYEQYGDGLELVETEYKNKRARRR